MSWRGRHCDNTTSSHGYTCHSDSSWCGCLCPARTLLSHMWIGFPYVHGFISLTTSKHWHCWDHCQDRRHSWGSSSYSCPQWVWYGGGNIWHWGTNSNQRGKRGENPCPLWVMPLPISPTDIASQATEFTTTYHGKHVEGRTTMADCRQKFYAYNICKRTASAPKLCSPPPTLATFSENAKRCLYQVCNWKSVLLPDPPWMSPAEFGWEADIGNKTLLTQSLPYATEQALDYTLRLIQYSCHSGVPCKAGNSSCLRNQLTCTVFSACEGNRLCCNPYTEHTDHGDDYLHIFDDADADFTIDHCGEPRPWFDIISSLMMLWRVQRYWWSGIS